MTPHLAVADLGGRGVVVWETADGLAWGSVGEELSEVPARGSLPGTAPSLADDDDRSLLLGWEHDGRVFTRPGKATARGVRWGRPEDLGPGSAVHVAWDGAAFHVAWQTAEGVSTDGVVSPGAIVDLDCHPIAGCGVVSERDGKRVLTRDHQEEVTASGQLAMGQDGPWFVWNGAIQRPDGSVNRAYRMGPPVALQPQGADLDWYVRERGVYFRTRVVGDSWTTFGVGVPEEPAESLVVDGDRMAWWACGRVVRTGRIGSQTHRGWDPSAIVALLPDAGEVARVRVDDGGVEVVEVLRGTLKAGDWLAAPVPKGEPQLEAGSEWVLVTAPNRLTPDTWSLLPPDRVPANPARWGSTRCDPVPDRPSGD